MADNPGFAHPMVKSSRMDDRNEDSSSENSPSFRSYLTFRAGDGTITPWDSTDTLGEVERPSEEIGCQTRPDKAHKCQQQPLRIAAESTPHGGDMSTITKPSISPTSSRADNAEPTNAPDSGMDKAQILSQTTKRRDEATKLLSSLLEAKRVSERNLATIRQDDLLKRVTGNSSMDNAIASTRKLIDSFNRVIDDLRRNLSDDELSLS